MTIVLGCVFYAGGGPLIPRYCRISNGTGKSRNDQISGGLENINKI